MTPLAGITTLRAVLCSCAGPAVSGVGVQLVSALQHLTGYTEQLKDASREAKAAAEAAVAAAEDAVAQKHAAQAAAEDAVAQKQDLSAQLRELKECYRELQDAYVELQQKHGTLTVSSRHVACFVQSLSESQGGQRAHAHVSCQGKAG